MALTKQKRGAYRREETVFVGTWIPAAWVRRIDNVVKREDSDRSKIIRRALERKLQESA